ncbi:unnamed protein product, partial [Prorocentrum cordatum]
VEVLHLGDCTSPEERGWIYGRCAPSGQAGWLPQSCVLRAPPLCHGAPAGLVGGDCCEEGTLWSTKACSATASQGPGYLALVPNDT